MDGFEVCSAIRSEPANNNVAVIFHSASGHARSSPMSSDSGADAFLTYPVDSEHLISVIRGCIQRRLDTHGKKSDVAGKSFQAPQE
jgi:DNA-binding response OmpR family regulator